MRSILCPVIRGKFTADVTVFFGQEDAPSELLQAAEKSAEKF
jgi:hypothetical protein